MGGGGAQGGATCGLLLRGDSWPRGSTGVQRYGCIGRDPSKIGSSKSLVLKSFGVERTFWDLSLLVSLTLWDTPVLFTRPLPLPQEIIHDYLQKSRELLGLPCLQKCIVNTLSEI